MSRLCRCGCNRALTPRHHPNASYFDNLCRRRAKNGREQVKSLPGRLSAVSTRGPRSLRTEPRVAVKVCRTCYDLPDRRKGTCSGCGRGHAEERIR